MPLHGKIVVIKRSGGDGTEFPLTATCLFGRKPDCDIRIQLPHVSKEHCRIDLNENKEVVLTNLSSVNPTLVNGEALQQSERLKHGDVITIIDRSFRFEHPPAPTPKKRASTGGKVLQDQQEALGVETSEVSTDPHLKDGTNHENIQRSLDKTVEELSKGDDNLLQNKAVSPFSDLYQMIKKSLDVATPRKSSASLLQTPTSRFCTPKPCSVRQDDSKPVVNTEDRSSPVKDEVVSVDDQFKGCAGSVTNGTPKSDKKKRRSFKLPATEMIASTAEDEHSAKSEATSPLKRNRSTPQRFTACEVIGQITAKSPKSPVRRRSKEATPTEPAVTEPFKRTSPRNSGKAQKEMSKKRKSGELGADLPTSQMKKKRVSFGGYLSPELFDKRLPPDSPLRKGADPRRSLCLAKPKLSLLRRASVIGYRKEFEHGVTVKTPSPRKKSPKSKTPSPKAASPPKKSPKSKTPSPKAASPAKKSPKSKTPSPKAASPAKKSPKSKTPSPKAASTAKKSPKSKTPSPEVKKIPKARSTTSTSITPSKAPLSSGVQTPTVQGRFSVSRISTPSPVTQDTVSEQLPSIAITPKIPPRRTSMKSTSRKTPKVTKSALKVIRRSGISRASMKAMNSWADIVKFGQTKIQVPAPAKKTVTKKATKKTVPKPQTPARKLKGHVSTGHADSPVTIVVGKAYKQKVVHPTGAAPRVVTNVAFLKKDMKMDEDLTGITEMFKTPLNERKRRSVLRDDATKTPVGGLGMSMEPSVLSTPEEPGEMIVSPLSVASTVKDRRYNSEAVQRLFDAGQESCSFIDVPTLEFTSDSSEQHGTDLKTSNLKTPKQNPEPVLSLTGVKRIMKTPRQKAEPVEDIRGRLLKTPKQKPEPADCLTGVKRIMKTPRQKAAPVEDIRGRLLKTPKQKPEPADCLTGVKRIMKTPRQKAEPVEDIRGRLLKTPKHKPPQQECLTGLKEIMKTPKSLEDDVMLDSVEELLQTPAPMRECEDLTQVTNMKPESMKRSPSVCLMTQTSPIKEAVVKRLMKTPREKGKPVEDNFGIKRLMRSPRLRGNAPVEDFEGLQELMEEPQSESTEHVETNEVEDQTNAECAVIAAEELTVREESQDSVMSHVSQVDMAKEEHEVVDNHVEGVMENITLATVAERQPVDSSMDTCDHLTEECPKVENTAVKVTEVCSVDNQKKSRGRKTKAAESKPTEDKSQGADNSEDAVVSAPVRGRRGKKTETTAPPGVTQQKTRNKSKNVELTMKESAPEPSEVVSRPKRGRCANKASQDQAEVQTASTEADSVSVSIDQKTADSASPEKTATKPRRGRKNKADSEQPQTAPDQDIPQDDNTQGMETTAQEPVTESLPQAEMVPCTEVDAAVKKPVRGRRAKMMEEEAAISAPVRGRRGKKTEAAPPAVKQTSRSRNAKSQTVSSQPEAMEETAVETLTEISVEAINDQTTTINASQEENDSSPPVVKTTKGRRAKTPVEPLQPKPEKTEVVRDQNLVSDAQLPQPVDKPRRGKKATAEPKKVPEDTVVPPEAKQPVGRAKRGRNAKQEEKLENESMENKSEEPVTKSRKTRKIEQTEPTQEIQTAEIVESIAEAPLVAEPVMINKSSAVTAKPRRGGRKPKEAESETSVESTVVQEVPAVGTADKPKRGARGRLVVESKVTAAVPKRKAENDLEVEEETTAEPEPVVKSSRTRGVRTEPSRNIPAKRARRGAAVALEEGVAEPAVLVSAAVEPAKRGRRAAAKPSVDGATGTSDQADTQTSTRSVRWKADVEVFNIPKETPVKALRGRKSRAGDKVEAESKNVSKEVNQTEEKDLSDKTDVAQPVKRARRGTKVTDEAESSKVDPKKGAEAETRPKTRRGRQANK
ncbi:proliferation marker protein Ki-67 [Betta splendens]|uniref:Proliferation marker protein Ki-67 n=1 Tax=Betta splendens TaxID=158456 RepID=A0A6P7L382_BETSP|nr:proliferation marker protein Ki-67 [Betta splendens]